MIYVSIPRSSRRSICPCTSHIQDAVKRIVRSRNRAYTVPSRCLDRLPSMDGLHGIASCVRSLWLIRNCCLLSTVDRFAGISPDPSEWTSYIWPPFDDRQVQRHQRIVERHWSLDGWLSCQSCQHLLNDLRSAEVIEPIAEVVGAEPLGVHAPCRAISRQARDACRPRSDRHGDDLADLPPHFAVECIGRYLGRLPADDRTNRDEHIRLSMDATMSDEIAD